MYALIATTLFASLAVSASIPGLPPCANSCISSFGNCGTLDVKCVCSDNSLISGLACCVSTACTTADQEKTIQFADALCGGYGVTNLPSSATCASTSGPTSSVTPVPQLGASPMSMSSSMAISGSGTTTMISNSTMNSTLMSSASGSTSPALAVAQGSATPSASPSSPHNAGSKNQAMELGILAAVLAAAL